MRPTSSSFPDFRLVAIDAREARLVAGFASRAHTLFPVDLARSTWATRLSRAAREPRLIPPRRRDLSLSA